MCLLHPLCVLSHTGLLRVHLAHLLVETLAQTHGLGPPILPWGAHHTARVSGDGPSTSCLSQTVLEHGIPSEQQRAAPTDSTAAWAGRTVASAAQEAGRHGAGGVWWGSTCCSSMARRSFCRTAKLTSGSPLIAESSSWYRLTVSMPCPKPQFLSWGNECLPAWKGSSWVEGVVSQQPPPPSSSFLPKITVPVLGGQEPFCPEGFL